MNKTSVERKLPCGCTERRWAFGREIVHSKASCPSHGIFAPKPGTYYWIGRG